MSKRCPVCRVVWLTCRCIEPKIEALEICQDCKRKGINPMKQEITELHNLDAVSGAPAGGTTAGVGIQISWQNGPIGRGSERRAPNGAFVEGVIQAALGRLQHYQSTKFNCRENALAITKLEEALHWLESRTANREVRQVEGTHGV